MYLVDTNIVLELMLSQSRKDECRGFLQGLREGRLNGFFTDFSIYSIMILMWGLSKTENLKTFLTSLTAYRGLSLYHTTLKDKVKATEISLQQHLDMDDSIRYSAALKLRAKAIVSFDKHFDGLQIPRIEPRQILA